MSHKPETPLKPAALIKSKKSLEYQLDILEKNLSAKFAAASKEQSLRFDALQAENLKISQENLRITQENVQLRQINARLIERVDNLVAIVEKNVALQTTASIPPPPDPVPAPPVEDSPEEAMDPYEAAEGHDSILILSDSIFRHVGIDGPPAKPPVRDLLSHQRRYSPKAAIYQDFSVNSFAKEPLPIRKVVIPGARCGRIFLEAQLIARENRERYKTVIVHVGANYVRTHSPFVAQKEIEDLLMEIQCLFPDSFVTFSETLPQYCEQSEDMNSAINFDILKVNVHIKDFCHAHGFGSFGPDVFFSAPDHYVEKLYAKDGLHLGRRGIDSLYRALGSFLAYSVMHDYCIG